MNDRAKIFLGAVVSLLLVVLLLAPRAPQQQPASRPLSNDHGDRGLMGLAQWLRHNHIGVSSWRRRYNDLSEASGLPAKGNLLITSVPHAVPARSRELDALEAWVGQGNAVLILAAELDAPNWKWLAAMHYGKLDTAPVLKRFGFEFTQPGKDKDKDKEKDKNKNKDEAEKAKTLEEKAADQEEKFRKLIAALDRRKPDLFSLRPRLQHPRLNGVNEVTTQSLFDTPPAIALSGLQEWNLALALLGQGPDNQPVFWEAAAGRGTVWVSAYPDLFGNVTLGKADNARLLANLLHRALHGDGRVIFDDFHFGLSDVYDPTAFFGDRRLHISLLFILGFWLAWVFGRAGRLTPAAAVQRVPHESDFVEALAGLCARRLKPRAVVSGLSAHFFNELRRRHRWPENGQPAWELLDRHSAVPRESVYELRRLVDRAGRGEKVKLNRFTHLLNNIGNAL